MGAQVMELVDAYLLENPCSTRALSAEHIKLAATKILINHALEARGRPERAEQAGPGTTRLAAILFVLFADEGLERGHSTILGLSVNELFELLEIPSSSSQP